MTFGKFRDGGQEWRRSCESTFDDRLCAVAGIHRIPHQLTLAYRLWSTSHTHTTTNTRIYAFNSTSSSTPECASKACADRSRAFPPSRLLLEQTLHHSRKYHRCCGYSHTPTKLNHTRWQAAIRLAVRTIKWEWPIGWPAERHLFEHFCRFAHLTTTTWESSLVVIL